MQGCNFNAIHGLDTAMTLFKVIATISWKFEADQTDEEALAYAKHQIDQIIQTHPKGEWFDGFSIQIDLAQMKDRKRLVHLGEFSPEDVFPFITVEESKREYVINGVTYSVRMNSDRYHVFKANPKCVACGMVGTRMILDINPGDQSPHFNLYGEEDGRLVLMTKDHILAKSKGGQDALDNFQTMCCTCNNLKGAYDLSIEDTRELRSLFNNDAKVPRKELREMINKRREEMSSRKKED